MERSVDRANDQTSSTRIEPTTRKVIARNFVTKEFDPSWPGEGPLMAVALESFGGSSSVRSPGSINTVDSEFVTNAVTTFTRRFLNSGAALSASTSFVDLSVRCS